MTRSTPSLRRVLAAGLLALAALGLCAGGPATAADTSPDAGAQQDAAIEHALPGKGAVRLLVSVPGTDKIDLAHVTASIAGTDVDATATAASSSNDVSRTSILAVDTSASMAGARIREAKKAATTYLATVPDNVKVGLLTFDDTVRVVVPPGLDRDAARTAVAGLRLTKQTALYDGVLAALEASGPSGPDAGQRKILLLSDGKDTVGGISPIQVAERAKQYGIPIFTVALGTANGEVEVQDQFGFTQRLRVPPDPATLREIAQTSGGRAFTAADQSKLESIYANLGTKLSSKPEEREVTAAFAGGALLLVLVGGGLSLAWFGRLV